MVNRLNLTAGVLAGAVRIIGPDLAAEGVGPIAFGQPRLQYVINADCALPWWPAVSVDLAAIHFGSAPASVDNAFYSPAVTELNLGGRYKFTVLGKSSTLRGQIKNVPNSYWWTTAYTPGFFRWPGPRTVFAYLTADL